MQVEQSYNVILELLRASALAARSRFNDVMVKYMKNKDYLNPKERVDLIKSYGTVRIAIGRQAGHTQAAMDFAKEFYKDQKVAFVCPCTDFIRYLKDLRGEEYDNILIRPWNDADSLEKERVRAIFVDPGPHAGSKARDAIYWSAAKSMDVGETNVDYRPILVYFIGS